MDEGEKQYFIDWSSYDMCRVSCSDVCCSEAWRIMCIGIMLMYNNLSLSCYLQHYSFLPGFITLAEPRDRSLRLSRCVMQHWGKGKYLLLVHFFSFHSPQVLLSCERICGFLWRYTASQTNCVVSSFQSLTWYTHFGKCILQKRLSR